MIIAQKIKIHLDQRPIEKPTVEAVQGETGRVVEFQLYNKGQEWTIPEKIGITIRHSIQHEGVVYTSAYDTLPDGSAAYSTNGSTLTIYLSPEVLSIWGLGELQIGLLGNDKLITTFTVLLRVQRNLSLYGITPQTHSDLSLQIRASVAKWAEENYGGYWGEDNSSIQEDTKAFILTELAKRGQLTPEFANSIHDCTDTSKLYVLPDGYIYAYMSRHIVEQTNEYNPNTAKLNYRLNSSAAETSQIGILLTDYISVALSNPYMVNIRGVSLSTKSYGFYVHVTYLDANKARIGAVQLTDASEFENFADGNYSFNLYRENCAAASYVRLSLGISAAAITAVDVANLMIEFAPKSVDEFTEGWANTGHAFVPADYEDRIVDLEKQLARNTAKLESLESNTDETIPLYWQSAVDAAVAKVKTLQDLGGGDVVNFVWFSDMHYAPGNQYVANLGSLCAAVMDACNIPLAVNSGDTMSAAIASTEDQLLQWLSGSNTVLAPVGPNRLLTTRGNHDDVYGCTDTVGYVNKASSKRIWNVLHRAQAADFRRVYGPDGTYFYIDNPAQRTRFIVLDGYRYSGDGYSNGTSSAMTSGYGQTQMAWFANEALPADKPGWSVVIVQHVPPTSVQINDRAYQIYGGDVFRGILTAYCNKSAYSGSYSGTEDNTIRGISVDYSNAQAADVIGVFCGHCHTDAIVSNDLPCPILTVTCANNTPYDNTTADRALNTATETALDIVSINKSTRTIHTTRLGIGEDRTVNY